MSKIKLIVAFVAGVVVGTNFNEYYHRTIASRQMPQ